jgi:hypothetical protein
VNQKTGVTVTATTTETGAYRVLLLPPGSYDVRVERDGFASQVKQNVQVTVGQAANIDFHLARRRSGRCK